MIVANVMAEYIKEDVEKKTSNDQSVKTGTTNGRPSSWDSSVP